MPFFSLDLHSSHRSQAGRVVWVFAALLGYFEQLRHQCHVPDALLTYVVVSVGMLVASFPGSCWHPSDSVHRNTPRDVTVA